MRSGFAATPNALGFALHFSTGNGDCPFALKQHSALESCAANRLSFAMALSPELLDQVEQAEGALDRKLDPAKAQTTKEERLHLDEKTFRWMHNEDAMATEKLAEGIRKFNSDARHLEEYALSQVAEKVG
jgi:Transaldolase/Fructose-6-phosphate aldolase